MKNKNFTLTNISCIPLFSKNIAFTNFLSKKCESKFLYFTHCMLTTPLTIMKPQILLRKQWHSWACYFSRKFLFLLFFEWLKIRLCFCGPRRPRGRLSSKLSRKNLRVRHFYLSLKFFVGQSYQLNFWGIFFFEKVAYWKLRKFTIDHTFLIKISWKRCYYFRIY